MASTVEGSRERMRPEASSAAILVRFASRQDPNSAFR
jgi:hypothetical protein